MSRTLIGSFALALVLLYPAAGSAQTHVDVGVWTPGGGGRVVIGGGHGYPGPYYGRPVYAAPVYAAPVYPAPVYPVYPAPVYPAAVYPAPVYAAPVYAAPVYLAPGPYYRAYYGGRYYAAPRPVYVAPGYRHDNGNHNGWYKNGKAYAGGYGNVRYYNKGKGGKHR